MSIYDFVEMTNDNDDIIFTVFDCNKDELVLIATDDGDKYDLTRDELLWSHVSDYEIGGTDIFYDEKQKCVRIEFNIDYEEEE